MAEREPRPALAAVQRALLILNLVMFLVVGGLVVLNLEGTMRSVGGAVYVVLLVITAAGGVAFLRRRAAGSRAAQTPRSHRHDKPVAPPSGPTDEETAAARRHREAGLEWEDVCRLVRPASAWWPKPEQEAFRKLLRERAASGGPTQLE